jgi:hypothetical protein
VRSTRGKEVNMKILRETLGYREEIDLGDPKQREEFVRLVVQDDEVGEALIRTIARDGWAEVNSDYPEYYERYTKL